MSGGEVVDERMDGFEPITVAARAAREAGIAHSGAVLLRSSSSVHVELTGSGVIARVERRAARGGAERQVFAARLLEQRGIAAARLAAVRDQPIVTAGCEVTFWQALAIHDGRPDAATLGRLARQLHDRTADELPAATPVLDPLSPIAGYLSRIESQSRPEVAAALRKLYDGTAKAWRGAAARDPLGHALIHGDFHQDNVVLTECGPVLVDLEDTGKGPRSWDFVPQIVRVRRYGGAVGDVDEFCRSYGADPRDWDGLDDLCRIYELFLGVWAIAYSETSPAMAREAPRRLATLVEKADLTWNLI